ARVHQQCGRDAAARRHAGKDESFLDVLEVAWKRLDARALLRTVGERPAHLPLVETGDTRSSRSRSEHTPDAVTELVAVRHPELNRRHNSRPDVVPEYDGAVRRRAGSARRSRRTARPSRGPPARRSSPDATGLVP